MQKSPPRSFFSVTCGARCTCMNVVLVQVFDHFRHGSGLRGRGDIWQLPRVRTGFWNVEQLPVPHLPPPHPTRVCRIGSLCSPVPQFRRCSLIGLGMKGVLSDFQMLATGVCEPFSSMCVEQLRARCCRDWLPSSGVSSVRASSLCGKCSSLLSNFSDLFFVLFCLTFCIFMYYSYQLFFIDRFTLHLLSYSRNIPFMNKNSFSFQRFSSS